MRRRSTTERVISEILWFVVLFSVGVALALIF